MNKRRRKGSYLFQRPDSSMWWIKLQWPTNTKKSLGTSDRQLAEVRAADLIADHKAALLSKRPRIEAAWLHEYMPDRLHYGPDGSRIMATQRELLYLDTEGNVIRRTPNGAPGFQLAGLERRLGIPFPVPIQVAEGAKIARPVLAAKNTDDAVFEIYLKHASVEGYYRREAESVWELYKQLTDSKPLKDATRDDGRKVAAHFEAQGLKSATIRKKLMWLAAAVNLAIKEGRDDQPNRLTFNPFSGVVPEREDHEQRLPLDDADMRTCKRNLDRLNAEDQLLFRLLATTGMRLSEAFEIDEEMKERGYRYVVIGSKTPQSKRRVPLPSRVLPYLPKPIKGPLLRGGVKAASKRLNRFLDSIGITDTRKVIHSLRHRAQDRLRAAECPQDIRWALLGHEEKSVAEDYGKGFSVPQLKKWIEKIGY